ncbi:MAG: FAD-dependent oxidoreductase [Myxococcota bacterium]
MHPNPNPLDITLFAPLLTSGTEQSHFRRKVVCQRPFRDGGVRLEGEATEGKFVVHCYGHGGSGWTLGPGCGNRVRDLIVGHLESDGASDGAPDVTILGGGVIGLFAAYALAHHKRANPRALGKLSIVAERYEDLASNNAGGLFEPFAIDGDLDIDLLVSSYDFYHRIALGRAPEPEFEDFDIELLPMFSDDPDAMPSLSRLGYIPHGVPAKLHIGEQQHSVFAHHVFFMDVALLMRHLIAVLTRMGVEVVRGVSVKRFDELESPVVVNCTGLGARVLTPDRHLRPVLGHLIQLQSQPRALLDIDHHLHIMANQAVSLKDAITPFRDPAFRRAVDNAFATCAGTPDNFLENRFRDDWRGPCHAAIETLFAAIAAVESNLVDGAATPDPDLETSERIRVFSRQRDRNQFVDGLALLWRAAECAGASEIAEAAMRLLCSSVTNHLKRYIFVIQRSFPSAAGEGTQPGLAYFMPILHEPVLREPGGRFRYASEHGLDAGPPVGVLGGTTIDAENLEVAQHLEEFDGIVRRMRHLGLR